MVGLADHSTVGYRIFRMETLTTGRGFPGEISAIRHERYADRWLPLRIESFLRFVTRSWRNHSTHPPKACYLLHESIFSALEGF